MISKVKTLDQLNKQRIAYFDSFNNVGDCKSIIDSLLHATQLPVEIKGVIEEAITQFLRYLHNDVSNLKSVNSLREYYSACKNRYDDLSTICSHLLSADDQEVITINRINKEGEEKFYLLGGRNRKVTIKCNGEECYYISRRPGVYKFLFRCLPESIEILNVLIAQFEINQDDYHHLVKDIVLALTTIAKIYEDIRGGDQFIDQEYEETILRMNVEHHLDAQDEFFDIFRKVKSDIIDGRSNPKSCLNYVRDIVRAIPERLDPFQYEDYHVSFRSTGTSIDREPIPGLYASIVEVDNIDFNDKLIGYISSYNKSQDTHIRQFDRKSIMIEQHKLPYRLIHMASNPIQDRCNYYHNKLMKVLNQLRVDCTIDQGKGISFAKLVSHPKFRARNRNNIYCLDISKATDTLNKEFQKLCIEILFGPDHAEAWNQLITGRHSLVKKSKTIATFEQQCGQPQGYKSSFPAFAWVHHIIMRMTMYKHNLTDMNPADFYRVLGDDSIISVTDNDDSILASYIKACQFVNWKCHESKGYIYRYRSDEVAFAEFAKVRILDGEVCTPIPIRLLLNASKSPSDYISYLWWLTKNYRKIRLEDALMSVYEKFPYAIDSEKASNLMLLWYLKVSVLKDFEIINEEAIDRKVLSLSYLAYIKAKLRQTLLNQFIPDNLLTLSDSEKVTKVSPFLDTDTEKKLLGSIENSEHKYVQILQRNQDIINILSNLFDERVISNIGILSLNISDRDRDDVLSLCEHLLMIESIILVPDFEVLKPLAERVLVILDRYNTRSDIKSAKQEANLLDNYNETLSLYFNLIEQEALM